jgi:hypothetical protein
MNQTNNLVQWKNLTEDQKAGFDFEGYKYEEQHYNSNQWMGYVSHHGRDTTSVYRLVIEPDKFYYWDDGDGIGSGVKKGKDFITFGYKSLRPAKPEEIPKPKKPDFIADWLDANVWDGEDLSRCENLISVTMSKVHLNPHTLHELFTECFEFAIEKAKELEK